MTKLYGLVQAAGFCFRVQGVVVGVRANSIAKLREVEARLPWGYRRHRTCAVRRLYFFCFHHGDARPGLRRYHALYGDTGILARTDTETELFDEFERDLNFYIAQSSPNRFFVHAGVVAWNGVAIVIPGKSHTGKSTLVRAFLQQGATYYSDEYAVFDRNGYVHPYARPLAIRKDSDGRQTKVMPSSLGCEVGQKCIRVGLVLLTYFRRSSHWRPRALSATRGALGLLANSFSGRKEPARALFFAAQAASKATVLSGVRGEAGDVARAVLCVLQERKRGNARSSSREGGSGETAGIEA